eukprot:9492270-Pyramimonas_sp.AAC.1
MAQKNCNNEGSGGSGSMYVSRSADSKTWSSIALPIALRMLAGYTFLAAARNSPDSFSPVSVTCAPRGCEQRPLPGVSKRYSLIVCCLTSKMPVGARPIWPCSHWSKMTKSEAGAALTACKGQKGPRWHCLRSPVRGCWMLHPRCSSAP